MRVLAVNCMFVNALYRKCADELAKMPGVELTILSPNDWKMNGGYLGYDPIPAEANYRAIAGKGAWLGLENRAFYLTGLTKAFRAAKPDVILLMEEPFSIEALQVLMVRALLAPEAPVVFFTWTNLSLHTFDYRPSFFYRNVARWTLRRMQYALTANSDGRTVLKDSGFKGETKLIGYGVDTEHYAKPRPGTRTAMRAKLGFSEKDFVIGYVGRILHMKGLDLLVKAVAQLRAELPRPPKVLLVGSGEFEQEFFALAKSHGISELIRHVPTVPQSDVPDHMLAMDVMALPSRRKNMWAEQFGRVIVEAMAARRIVVGSTSGAIPEVIGDGGFTFKEEDASDLARVLHKVHDLPVSERDAIGERGFRRATEHFSWRRFAKDAMDAMHQVMKAS